MKILVPWFHFGLQGAISRFINIKKYMDDPELGVQIEFCSLINDTTSPFPNMPKILTFEEAKNDFWDATFIPGAGAGTLMRKFADLRHPNFGKRFQFILNSPQLKDRFVQCNEYLGPDVIIINNRHWDADQLQFKYGEKAYILPGAVDINLFQPADTNRRDRIVVGGFMTKNPRPLVSSNMFLPENYLIKFWGGNPFSGPDVMCVGKLFGQDLADYYNSLDIFVTTETHAGWCNPAAEAMACGVPLICSPWGTTSFAYNNRTALVLQDKEITGEDLAERILKLGQDDSRWAMGSAGSNYIREHYSWEKYCKKLYTILEREGI